MENGKINTHGLEVIKKDTERDHFLDANEAKEYGLVDHVIVNNPEKTQASNE